MATLTNTKIKDTYDGLLKTTDNDALDVSGVTLIEDGLGNASALSVGRSGNGVSVSGLLDVSGEVQGTSLDINGDGNISGDLEINDTISGSVATNYAPNVLVGGNIVARSLTANAALIEIGGDATSAFITAGKQDGSQTSRALRFEVGTSEAMRIDSSGNVGIGESNPSSKLHISEGSDNLSLTLEAYASSQSANARIGVSRADFSGSTSVMTFSTNTGSGLSEAMRIDSSGNVGVKGNALLAAGLGYAGDTTSAGAGKIELYDTSTGALIIDGFGAGYLPNSGIQFKVSGSERMRILSSGGITFNGDTSSANALDDYEEGTWTPVLKGSVAAGSYTHSIMSGKYTKIGNMVTVWCTMVDATEVSAASGDLRIGGLPFNIDSDQVYDRSVGMVRIRQAATSRSSIIALPFKGTDLVGFLYNNGGSEGVYNFSSDYASGMDIGFSFSYFV